MNNVDLIKTAYKHFANRDFRAAKSMFDPKIEWTVSEGLPFIHDRCTFVGPEDIQKNIFDTLPLHIGDYSIQPDEIFGADDKVVMVGRYKGVFIKTGDNINASVCHIFTLKEGKIARFFQVLDTAVFVEK